MRKMALAAVLMLTLTSLAAYAHHGWGSYDASRPLTIEGPVESVGWANPHVELVMPHDGALWHITLAPLSRMQRRGLSPELLQAGTLVAVQGYPSRRTANEMRAERLVIGGQTYELR